MIKMKKRARTSGGRYRGDDKSTVNFNEAWIAGKAPGKNWIQQKWQKLTDWFFKDFYGR